MADGDSLDRDQIVTLVRDAEPHLVTAPEIGEAFDVDRRVALRELDVLTAAGRLESRSVGARGRVFWHPDRVVPPASTDADRNDTRDPTADRDDARDDVNPQARAERLARRVEVSGSGRERRARRAAVAGALKALLEAGEAQSAHLREAAFDRYLEAHDVADAAALAELPVDSYGGDEPDRSLWTTTILGALREVDDVERIADTQGGWRAND